MSVIEIKISFRLISEKSIYHMCCVRVCVSIRRYPRSSGSTVGWMIQAESCVKCVCALCEGQCGGSGSQLVVGIVT